MKDTKDPVKVEKALVKVLPPGGIERLLPPLRAARARGVHGAQAVLRALLPCAALPHRQKSPCGRRVLRGARHGTAEQTPEGRRPAAENGFRRGFLDGVPIGLGYFSVSIAFGILCAVNGMDLRATVLISMTNLTSAGQLAGAGVIFGGGTLLEMALTQLVINLRYALMSISLSQKLHKSVRFADRLWVSFFITDEIFADIRLKKPGEVGRRYFMGVAVVPYLGWALGTLAGAVAGALLPQSVQSAMGVALYGMFVAIVVPAAKAHRPVLGVAALAAALSCLVRYVPFLHAHISSGFSIILCTACAALAFAWLPPVQETEVSCKTAQMLCYIAVMAGTTYLIRALPMLLVRRNMEKAALCRAFCTMCPTPCWQP